MKKYLIMIFLLITALMINGSVIVLNNDEIIKGEIVKEDEAGITIKVDENELSISKGNIKNVYYNDIDYYEDKMKIKQENIEKKNKFSEEFKVNNNNHKLFLSYLRAGFGLIIPGSIMLFIGCGFFINTTTAYADSMQRNYDFHTNKYNYYYDNSKLLKAKVYSIVGMAFFGTGLILDIISIIMFVVSAKYHNKYLKDLYKKISFNLIIDNNKNIGFGFNFKI